jgi:hypothetical protein
MEERAGERRCLKTLLVRRVAVRAARVGLLRKNGQ